MLDADEIETHSATIFEMALATHNRVFEDAKTLNMDCAADFLSTVTGILAQAYVESLLDGLGEDPTPEAVNAVLTGAFSFLAAQVTNAALGIETPLSFDNVAH